MSDGLDYGQHIENIGLCCGCEVQLTIPSLSVQHNLCSFYLKGLQSNNNRIVNILVLVPVSWHCQILLSKIHTVDCTHIVDPDGNTNLPVFAF